MKQRSQCCKRISVNELAQHLLPNSISLQVNICLHRR